MKAEGWREAFGELDESCAGKKKKTKQKGNGTLPARRGVQAAQECRKTRGRRRAASGASGTDAGDLICDASSALGGNAERQQARGSGKVTH